MNKPGEKVNLEAKYLYPATPPDGIFENQGFRNDPSKSVAQEYTTYVYDADRPGGAIEYRKGEGIFVHYKGVEYPRNGLPYAQAVYAVNGVKRLIAHAVKLLNSKELRLPLAVFLLLSKKKRIAFLEKALNSLNQIAVVSLAQFYMEYGYFTKTAKEVWRFVMAMFMEMGISEPTANNAGKIMAMIIEYDDAYRFPFQDCMSETTKEKLMTDFPKEVTRLLELQSSRENTGKNTDSWNRYVKFQNFGRLLRLLWRVPSIRKAIKAGLEAVNHESWQLDKSDIYHSYLWADYNVRGKTTQERVAEYMGLYGNDPEKMPPRVTIKINQPAK